MNEELLKIADGLLVVSEGIRTMVNGEKTDAPKPVQETQKGPEQEAQKEPELNIEDVRAVLASKSASGKRKEVKELLLKYGSGKLSGIKPEDYAALLSDAEAL